MFFFVFLAAADPALMVSPMDRAGEVERLQKLGLKVTELGLERPWDAPLSKRSLIVPQAWFAPPKTDTVKASALAADLPILELVMSRAYGGWDTAAARGWDWTKWFSDWRGMLTAHKDETLSFAEAFAPVKALIAFQLDNHTNIPLSRATFFGSGSQQAVLPRAPSGECTELEDADAKRTPLDAKDPAQRPRTVQRWNGTASRPPLISACRRIAAH